MFELRKPKRLHEIDTFILDEPVTSGVALGNGVKLFFEGDAKLLSVAAQDGLRISIAGAGLEFVSLAVDLPGDILLALDADQLVGLQVETSGSVAATATARLNLEFGGLVQSQTEPTEAGGLAEFDLSYLNFDASSLSHSWIDFIWAHPEPGEITICGIAVFTRTRATL